MTTLTPPPQPKYHLYDAIGKGCHGLVYRAVDENDEPVAVKLMTSSAGIPGEEIFYQYFKNKKHHKNINHTRDMYLTEDGQPAMAMELLDGMDLMEIIDEKISLTDECKKSIMLDVLQALVFLREQDVVHRDFKCENIFVTTDGIAKLIDFGMSSTLAKHPVKDIVRGTPLYSTYQLLTGKTSYYDFQDNDAWGAAVCFYEMINGDHPSKATKLESYLEELKIGYPPLKIDTKEAVVVNWMILISPELRMTPEEAYQALISGEPLIEHHTLGKIPDNLYHRYLRKYKFLESEEECNRILSHIDMELVPKNMGTMDRLIFQRKMDEIPDKIVISGW